jgi:hypothetical protein
MQISEDNMLSDNMLNLLSDNIFIRKNIARYSTIMLSENKISDTIKNQMTCLFSNTMQI